MKKKYELPADEDNTLNEPAMEYECQAKTEMTYSPPLTEEELKNSMTGDELREYMRKHIHELFNNK